MKKTIHVDWMHCVACETLMEHECDDLGCSVHHISHKKWIIEVDVPNNKVFNKLKKAIRKNGYTLLEEWVSKVMKQPKDWSMIVIILGGVGLLLYVLSFADINSRVPAVTANAWLWVALIMWLVASVSTCLAVTGSIVIGFSNYLDDTHKIRDHAKVQGMFHFGRWAGFFVLWGLLGLLGQTFQFSLSATAMLTIIVSIVLLYMGLYMLDIVPNITKFGFHLPRSWTKKLHTEGNPTFAPIVGALTFLLPCGFTQSMQLLAMQSGGFLSGGLTMLLFAVGTTPVLFVVGMGWSYIKDHKMKPLMYAIGSLIFYFSLFNIANAWNLWGWSFDVQFKQDEVTDTANIVWDTVSLGHDWIYTVPYTTNLEAWKSYKVTIIPESNGLGCMSTLVIPSLDRTVHPVVKWKEITYEFANMKKGKYPIVCGSMGMPQGELVVK